MLHIFSFNFLPSRNQIIVTFPTITSQLNFNLYSFLQTTNLFHQIILLKKNKDWIAHTKSQIYFLITLSIPYFSTYFHLLKLKQIFQYSFLLHICPPISRLRCGIWIQNLGAMMKWIYLCVYKITLPFHCFSAREMPIVLPWTLKRKETS